jgi:hypothetical protein
VTGKGDKERRVPVDAEALLADADARGWGEEAARHRRLLERLDQRMAQTEAS